MTGRNLPGLAGKRIALTRARAQAGDFERTVAANSGIPIICPAIQVEDELPPGALDAILTRGTGYDWIVFTSVNAVVAFCGRSAELGFEPTRLVRGRIAAVGRATAAKVKECIAEPDIVASGESAQSLAREIGEVKGASVLFPRGNIAQDTVARILTDAGATVDSPIVYRTVPAETVTDLANQWASSTLDAVLFASPSAVHAVAAELTSRNIPSETLESPAIFCLGESTSRAASAAGFVVAATADANTQDSLLEAVSRWFEQEKNDY